MNPVIWFLIFYQILFNFKRNNDEDEDDTENDDQDDGPTCFFGMFFFFSSSLLFLFCVKFLFPFFLFPTTRTLALSILFPKDDYDDEDIFFFFNEKPLRCIHLHTHTRNLNELKNHL